MTTKAETAHKRKSADQIFALDDTRREDVWMPEWDCWVLLQGLTGAGRDGYEASILVGKGSNQTINARNARAKLIVLCAIKEDGSPLFTKEQIEGLGKKSGVAVQRLFDVARKLSGLSDEDMEELTEAFAPAQNGAGTSN